MLVRAVARVGRDGKILIPNNVRRQAGLKPGRPVELRVVGASKKKTLLLSTRAR
jgi:bifunctional DNA-binding transcriptional regulator/antitoxin component of YhaV-PrlF toxin-antitoxin module